MNKEFQAVILAGGEGDRLYPLTGDIPKALLPIANMPMIYYPLSYLEHFAPTLKEVIIVLTKKSSARVISTVKEVYKGKLSLIFETVDDDTDSADALRSIHKHIKVYIFYFFFLTTKNNSLFFLYRVILL
mgnify:CR=1 FL=1